MDKLLDEIESYWSTRTEGYSEVNEKELNGMQKRAWLETLELFMDREGCTGGKITAATFAAEDAAAVSYCTIAVGTAHAAV